MKSIFISLLFSCSLLARDISQKEVSKIADCIYKVENSKNFPYGIKSIKTNNPRKICENTIRNNFFRWKKQGQKGDFLDFLADRYCPAKADKTGNSNWKKNIHKFFNGKLTKESFI